MLESIQKPLICKKCETEIHIPLVEEFEMLMETGKCMECNQEDYATEESMEKDYLQGIVRHVTQAFRDGYKIGFNAGKKEVSR